MKKRALLGMLMAFVLLFSYIEPVCAENRVSAQLNHMYDYFTDEDSIDNIPLLWDHKWHPLIHNVLDGGGPVKNPKVELNTELNLVSFQPDDPSVFTAEPPLYTWNFSGLEVEEPALLPLHAWMAESLTAPPGFSVSRSVNPVTLSSQETLQTITVNLRFEEPLPAAVNWFMISIGSPVIAYEEYRLVEGSFVSQNTVNGLNEGTDGVQAWWSGDPSNLDVGTTYEFQATLKSTKSEQLLGSPTFKPGVAIQWGQMTVHASITAKSVTITHPSGDISATFSADNEVDWEPISRESHFIIWLNPVVSEITPPPPPFHVLIPADVTIKPETLNLGSKGVITAFVQLPEEYSIKDVDLDTVKCQGAVAIRAEVTDEHIICKFDCQELEDLVPGEEVELKLSGELTDGTLFRGTDTIRVIDKGGKKK